jgi:hypothetical protein
MLLQWKKEINECVEKMASIPVEIVKVKNKTKREKEIFLGRSKALEEASIWIRISFRCLPSQRSTQGEWEGFLQSPEEITAPK